MKPETWTVSTRKYAFFHKQHYFPVQYEIFLISAPYVDMLICVLNQLNLTECQYARVTFVFLPALKSASKCWKKP